MALHLDNKICKTIDHLLFNFVWRNRTRYIKKRVVMNPHENGGLHFLDLNTLNCTFKVNWMKQFLKCPTSIWNYMPTYIILQLSVLNFLSLCHYNIEKLRVMSLARQHSVSLACTRPLSFSRSLDFCPLWRLITTQSQSHKHTSILKIITDIMRSSRCNLFNT